MKRMRVVLTLLMMISGVARAITYPFTTVDTPGFHKLLTNVSNQITISVSDVTLDLNGATVSGGTNGVVINGGLNNVTVINGTISSVSSDGVQVGAGCNDITLKDITVTGALRGMNLEQVTNALLRNCDMHQSTTGLELDTCHNILLQNCTARANTHAGFDLLSSTTCSFIECSALSTGDTNVDVDTTTVFGFVSRDGTGNLFERCIANATQALSVTGSSSLIAGFALRGDESCTKIIDSEAANSQTNADGFTVPYGILLEGTIDTIQSVTGFFGDVSGFYPAWSPDGQYIAAGIESNSIDTLYVLQFDRVSRTIFQSASALGGANISVRKVDWSPDGQYIAAGMAQGVTDFFQIFSFDRVAGTLSFVDGDVSTGQVRVTVWSSDGQYIAVAGSMTGDKLRIFSFDRAAGTVTSIAGALSGGLFSLAWSPDGQYVAAGGNVTGGFQVFSFDRVAGTLTSIDDGGISSGTVYGLKWSPDGEYVAVGGEDLPGGLVQVFSFDRVAGTLTSVTGALGTSGTVYAIDWSPNGQYIVACGDSIPGEEVQIFRFDRAAGTLTSVAGTLGGSAEILGLDWSPDGEYIAVLGDSLPGDGNALQVINALQFPEKNVIKGNTVYCNSGAQFPSGVGISGSSIANMIIGNTSYSNPVPRAENEPIVSSNYQFVTNVFNQLFGEGPSSIQNISTSSMTPLATVPDVPAKTKRVELLLESLIDNLL